MSVFCCPNSLFYHATYLTVLSEWVPCYQDERTILVYHATFLTVLTECVPGYQDEPLDHAPTLTTWCEVVDPQQCRDMGCYRPKRCPVLSSRTAR
eukprot:3866364-Rhodomonas_salina.1